MALSGAVRSIAARQIAQYGRSGTYRRTTGTTYTPGTGTTGGTTSEYAAHGLLQAYRAAMVDGTRVQAQDRRLLIAAKALEDAGLTGEPEPGDEWVSGSDVFSVVRVEDATYVGDSPVLFTVQVRR